jgi:protease I
MVDLSGKKVLMVVAPHNFRDEEAFIPKKILEEAGLSVVIVSSGVPQAKSMFGRLIPVEQDLSQAETGGFEAVVFVGGSGASFYFNHPAVLNLAKNFAQLGKVIGAICIAPSILANAGLLSGKRATAFSSESGNLIAKGAEYTGEPVTVDGKIITANGPEAAEEFANKIVEALGK